MPSVGFIIPVFWMKKLELGRLWSLPQATELECGRARNKIFWLQIQCSRIVVSEFASLRINSKKHVSVYLFLKRRGLLVSPLSRFPYPPPNEYTLASSNDCPVCVHKAVYQTDSSWSVCCIQLFLLFLPHQFPLSLKGLKTLAIASIGRALPGEADGFSKGILSDVSKASPPWGCRAVMRSLWMK